MDQQRFDNLARTLGSSTSRRGVLKVLIGGAVGGLGLTLGRKPVLANQTSDCEHYCNQYKHPEKQQCADACKKCKGGVEQMCGLTCGCPHGQECETYL